MKKILLTGLIATPLMFSPLILNNNIKDQNINIQNGYLSEIDSKDDKAVVFETLTENDVIAKEEYKGTGDYTWTFELGDIMESLSIEHIESIHIFEQEVNFRYAMEWKKRGFMDVPDKVFKYFTTMSGPGDANGHDGWNEANLDGHENDGHVIFNDVTLEFGHETKIASGWTPTHYDEYLDDGYGFEDNGSGYHWENFSIYAEYKYDNQNEEYVMALDWRWDSEMPYSVKWEAIDNTDGVLNTIGEIEVELIF